MPIRLTGLISGLDTDSLIKGMVDAQKLKNKRVSDRSQILEWKQEKLKELNSKLYKLYAEDLTKLKLQSSYTGKKVTSSNESFITVTGNSTAPTGISTIKIMNTASSQSAIGGILTADKNGKMVTTDTKLSELNTSTGLTMGSDIVITNGTKETGISLTADSTIGDLIEKLRGAGLNASFDSNQKRIFISSQKSGIENQFSIKNYGTGTVAYRDNIKKLVGYDTMTEEQKKNVISALDLISSSTSTEQTKTDATNALITLSTARIENEQKAIAFEKAVEYYKEIVGDRLITDEIKASFNVKFDENNKFVNSTEYLNMKDDVIKELGYVKGSLSPEQEAKVHETAELRYKQEQAIKSDLYNKEYIKSAESIKEKINSNELFVPENMSVEEYVKQKVQETSDESYNTLSYNGKRTYLKNMIDERFVSNEKAPSDLQNGTEEKTYTQLAEAKRDLDYLNNQEWANARADNLISITTNLDNYKASLTTGSNTVDVLSLLKLGEISNGVAVNSSSDMIVNQAKDAVIEYNGVEITSSSNTINVNGFTITVKGIPANNEIITLSTTNDNQSTIDSVKNFVKKYNEILKEMNDLYFADSSRGYEPLSDDEKAEMTDSQIEKWEKKIKDSVLRRDNSLGGIITAMKQLTAGTITGSDGKTYSLASIGIGTSSDYTEKGLLHIDGDSTDSTVSYKENKLQLMLDEAPELVANILSKSMEHLYKEIDSKIKAIPNIRSAFTFYNDKSMTTEQTKYKKKIKELESKLSDIEAKYYKQFAAMEKAMSRMQAQQSQLAGFFGAGQQ